MPLTVERLIAALLKHDAGLVNYIDGDDPCDVVIDGHFNLAAVVDELNGEK